MFIGCDICGACIIDSLLDENKRHVCDMVVVREKVLRLEKENNEARFRNEEILATIEAFLGKYREDIDQEYMVVDPKDVVAIFDTFKVGAVRDNSNWFKVHGEWMVLHRIFSEALSLFRNEGQRRTIRDSLTCLKSDLESACKFYGYERDLHKVTDVLEKMKDPKQSKLSSWLEYLDDDREKQDE